MTTKNKAPASTIWTQAEATKATQGEARGPDWFATGISIDTRTLQKGDLFIAITGDSMDGHDFALQALEKGASAVVISKNVDGLPDDASVLKVSDTQTAMEDLARAARARSAAEVIAITGSVGKTGTKEMLAAVYAAHGQTHVAQKSYNNHWGVPLTLSGMHAGTDYGIFEIGMNHAGEITPLTKMVRPHIAIITTVAPAHIGNFSNGIEGIADAKAEIFEGLEEGGIAIINRDMEMFDRVAQKATSLGINLMTFGEHPEAHIRMTECLVAANGTRVKATVMGEEVNYTLPIAGKHIAMNSLPVLGAIKMSGGSMDKATEALKRMKAPERRGAVETIDMGEADNPVTLIDETYNASPTSMNAAFKVLALVDPGRGGRRIAVLGDMLELGKDGPRLHKELALPLKVANVDLVYTCGPLMKNLHDNLQDNQKGAHTKTSKELAEIVPDVLTPGDVVMVKGSNGSKMNVVVEALRNVSGRKVRTQKSRED